VLIGSVIVIAVAWLTARWLDARTRGLQLMVGALWVALTLTFEILLGRAIGASWEHIASDYNPARGGFLLAGLAVLFFAPRFTAHLRGIDSGEPHDHAPGRMSLRTGTLRGGCARRTSGRRMQLLDVQPLRLPASHRAGRAFPPAQGPRRADHLHLQHRHAKHHFCATCG
jgi:hypothetical protein